MMINVVLYDESSVINIAKKAWSYFNDKDDFRTTRDTIWVNGLYLKFSPQLLTINTFNCRRYSPKELYDCLSYILDGEEIFISCEEKKSKYVEKVNVTTNFDKILAIEGV